MSRPIAALLGLILAAQPALAQEAGPAAAESETAISVELNDAGSVEGACRLTFLVDNQSGADLSQLALETVILTAEGKVDRLTLFDFRDLPAGLPRVRQFDITGLACDQIGRVLINGVAACAAEGVETAACAAALTYSSRAEGLEILG